MFQIGLHWDDLPLLNYLKDKLQCGYITQNPKEAKANFVIKKKIITTIEYSTNRLCTRITSLMMIGLIYCLNHLL